MLSEPPVFSEHGFSCVARDLLREPALPHPEGKEALIPRPNPEAVIHLADTLRKIIFPGYLEAGPPDPDTRQKKLDLEIQGLYSTEIILSYPGLLAITLYRLAQTLYTLGIPLLPRMITEYANATILGGETIIGARSVIGGNVWLTESVPPDTKVLMNRPDLIYLKN
jgi:hypothetical protein